MLCPLARPTAWAQQPPGTGLPKAPISHRIPRNRDCPDHDVQQNLEDADIALICTACRVYTVLLLLYTVPLLSYSIYTARIVSCNSLLYVVLLLFITALIV